MTAATLDSGAEVVRSFGSLVNPHRSDGTQDLAQAKGHREVQRDNIGENEHPTTFSAFL